MLEIACAFANDQRTVYSVVFLAVTAEETRLLGSGHYVANPIFPLATSAGVLNMDAPFGHGRACDCSIAGSAKVGLLDMLIGRGGRLGLRYVPDPMPAAGHFFRSDHFPFAKAGVPAVSYESGIDMVGGGATRGAMLHDPYVRERYHQAADEWSPGFDLSGAPQALELLHAVGRDLAESRE